MGPQIKGVDFLLLSSHSVRKMEGFRVFKSLQATLETEPEAKIEY